MMKEYELCVSQLDWARHYNFIDIKCRKATSQFSHALVAMYGHTL